MSNRSRYPLVLALILGLVAAVLLWWRPEAKDSSEPVASTPRPASSGAGSSAGRASGSAQPTSATPPLETPAAPTDGALKVRVVASGQPVEGARVLAYLRGVDDGSGEIPWRRAGEGFTGADGTVRLPAAPGSYLVSASAEGHASARRDVARPVGEAETAVELSLPSGVELRGRVITEQGEPVPLAELALHPYTGAIHALSRSVTLPEEISVASSDPRGRFTFSGLAPGRYELTVKAPGFSQRTLRIVTVPATEEVEIQLWAWSVLEGFVLGEDGQPATGAEVMALGGPDIPRTMTGPGGGFSLEVSNGTYVLAARQGERLGRIPHPLEVAPGETLRDLRIILGASSGLMGTVTTAPEGTPVAGARLTAGPASQPGQVGVATTGADGRYTLDLPPGSYDLAVVAPGRTSALRDRLEVTPGQWFTVDVQLDGATAVEGHVTDPAGRPVSGAFVHGQRLRGPEGLARTTRTDGNGAYRLEGLEVGMAVVSARREQTEHWSRKITELKPGAVNPVDFTLTETGIVQGRVRQASGAPLSQPAMVRAMAKQTAVGEFTFTDTDAAGGYQLELPAGVYQIIAVIPGARYTYSHQDDLSVTVPPGAAVVQDLSLSNDQGVRGTVLEPSGAPSPYATVVGIQHGDFVMAMPILADEEGHFIFPPRGINSTPLSLVAHNAGRVGELAEAREDIEVTVRLRPSATLRGRVVARKGAAPTGFSLQLFQEDGTVLPWQERDNPERTFSGDTFALYDAPALPLKVSVRTTDGRSGEASVKLSPGQSTELEVPLTGGTASVTGRAVWTGGTAPAEGVSIFLDKQLGTGSDARTGADGRFLVKNVKPGAHTVRLWASADGQPVTRSVTVASGEAVDLGDVAVATRRTASGTVGAGFSEDRGWVSVAWVKADGPAARAGVRVGDRLLAVDGLVVRSRQEAEQRTQGAPGSPVQLSIRHENGQEQQLQLTRAD